MEGFHTYYVGDQQVLVHNTCGGGNTSGRNTTNGSVGANSTKSSNSKNVDDKSNARTNIEQSVEESEEYSSFSELMSEDEAARYNSYWGKDAPDLYTPNSKIVHYKEKGGVIEKSIVIYDNVGRQKWRVDFNNHGYSDHSKPHLHERIYGPGFDGIKGKSI